MYNEKVNALLNSVNALDRESKKSFYRLASELLLSSAYRNEHDQITYRFMTTTDMVGPSNLEASSNLQSFERKLMPLQKNKLEALKYSFNSLPFDLQLTYAQARLY